MVFGSRSLNQSARHLDTFLNVFYVHKKRRVDVDQQQKQNKKKKKEKPYLAKMSTRVIALGFVAGQSWRPRLNVPTLRSIDITRACVYCRYGPVSPSKFVMRAHSNE